MKSICWLVAFCLTTTLGKTNDITEIYNRLTTAVGDYRNSLPDLEIRSGKRQVATYSKLNNKIYLDQVAIDICNQFGTQAESAIAFLLGHELTHFYQDHDWQESNFLSPSATFDQHILEEEEADTYGAFISHLAGFETVKIIPQLLNKIYAVYVDDQANLIGYPSLVKRKAVAQQVCKKVNDLIRVYETGNHLFALQQLEEAYYCYQYVSKFIRCKEVFNNLGATALYAASTFSSYNQKSYVYPIYLDVNLPIRAPSHFTKSQLLNIAIEHLSKATKYDPTYYTAFIKLACAYEMDNQYQKFHNLCGQLKSLPISNVQQSQLYILKGIAADKQNSAHASLLFQEAKRASKDPFTKNIIKQNERILLGKANQENFVFPNTYLKDKIDGYNLVSNFPIQNKRVIFEEEGFKLQIAQSTNAYYIEISNNLQLLITHSLNNKTQEGLGIGSSVSELEKIHDNFNQHAQFAGGHWIVIYERGLLFQLSGGKVKTWGIFMLR